MSFFVTISWECNSITDAYHGYCRDSHEFLVLGAINQAEAITTAFKYAEFARELREATGCSFVTSVEAVTKLHPYEMTLWSIAWEMHLENVSFSDLYVKTEWFRNGDDSESKMPTHLVGPKEHSFDIF